MGKVSGRVLGRVGIHLLDIWVSWLVQGVVLGCGMIGGVEMPH